MNVKLFLKRWWKCLTVLVTCSMAGGGVTAQTNPRCPDDVGSACGNGGSTAKYGYACPQLMMLSDAMIAAAEKDGLRSWSEYAVAGSASDAECGKCYQIQLLDAEREWRSNFKRLIVQVVNSGFDVLSYQFDIYMGGGGFGYFTSCNADCSSNYCQGGSCKQGMYAGKFRDLPYPLPEYAPWASAVYPSCTLPSVTALN